MSNIPDSNPLDPDRQSLRIEIVIDEGIPHDIDQHAMRLAAAGAAALQGFDQGEIGIRVTTDAAIQQINRDHLGHDYATDVISFGYRAEPPFLEGELVVSVETAEQRATEIGWPMASELTLYVVHGTLHITGMDDQSPSDRKQMRDAEIAVMTRLGIDDVNEFGADAAASQRGCQHE